MVEKSRKKGGFVVKYDRTRKKYMAYIDSLIESNDPDTDWDAETDATLCR